MLSNQRPRKIEKSKLFLQFEQVNSRLPIRLGHFMIKFDEHQIKKDSLIKWYLKKNNKRAILV